MLVAWKQRNADDKEKEGRDGRKFDVMHIPFQVKYLKSAYGHTSVKSNVFALYSTATASKYLNTYILTICTFLTSTSPVSQP